MIKKIKHFSQVEEFLNQFSPLNFKQKFPGELGLLRAKKLLYLLDNPQNKMKVIHIAGTSGKGSTAYLTSVLLNSQGHKVGLTLSPHLIDIRERIEINNQMISENKFVKYLNEILPTIDKMKDTEYGIPTYFEIIMALAFYVFNKEKVDYAVVETGLGGLFDATNSVTNENKIVILTKIGLDHTKILGKTLSKIALQKAEIIHEKNIVITMWQNPKVRKIFEEIVKKRNAKLFYIKPNKNIKINEKETEFDFNFQDVIIPEIKLKLIGIHQAENCGLALAVLTILAKREKFNLDNKKVLSALTNVYYQGRFDIKKLHNKTIILDGAHNPQKMSAFIKSVKKLYPNKKMDFLIAIKESKDYQKMMKYIIPLAKKIIVTNFSKTKQDHQTISTSPEEIKKGITKLRFNNVYTIPDTKKAFDKTLNETGDLLVITGSLYFLSDVYPLLENKIKLNQTH